MREGPVGLCHLVCVFALLHGRTAVVRGVEKFARQALLHRLLVAGALLGAGAEEAVALAADVLAHLAPSSLLALSRSARECSAKQSPSARLTSSGMGTSPSDDVRSAALKLACEWRGEDGEGV